MYEFEITKGVSVSFQRYPYPGAGSLSALPSSHGALPIHVSGPAQLEVPSPPNEAFWIALLGSSSGAASDVALLAYGRKGTPVDVLTGMPAATPTGRVTLPPHQFIAGIRQGTGTWWAFARDPSAPAPVTAAVDLFVRTWSGPSAATARPASPTPQHMPGQKSPDHGLAPPSVAAVAENRTLRIVFTDEAHFSSMSGRQVAPLSHDPGLRDRRLP
ncbi:hypothetical protein FBY31_1841 [Arthrobacter sp. SLBN-100]|uniref:hypothetical protein n=1 Tax=Arthrobacter sp. SLBN-100 TaxID=2768450 RepID=UPI001154DBA4|nr:hypothetical protein [Arthrobacter sp. SLBN-100]TQJ67763.1 hypothetical protein FBY31_1841 [Arthrobacter sp. SLBN-100]